MQKKLHKPFILLLMIITCFFATPPYIVRAETIKTDLITAKANVEAAVIAETQYTPSSFALFATAIDNLGGITAIQTIIDDPLAEQITIDNLIDAIGNALSLLVLRADITALNAANNAAISAYYGDRNLYTSSSYSQFVAAVLAYGNYQAADAILDDPEVVQTDVDNLTLLINDAISQLELKADTTILENVYEMAINFNLAGNTPMSIDLFHTELERIRLIMIGDDTNSALCTQTIADVEAAYDLLIPLADKTLLQIAINQGDNIKAEKYTITSYYILDTLLTAAKMTNADANALQTDVDQLVLNIDSAIEGLIYTPTKIELTVDGETINLVTYITVGDSTISGYTSKDPTIASVDAFGNVSGVGFGNTEIIITLANGVVETISVFVKEKITTVTLILISIIPVVATGLGIAMIVVKTRPVEIVQRVKTRYNKAKKTKPIDIQVDSER
ncbi:MAG: hypothetical protein WCX25_00150 [Candidatus Izemoplasmatales bacterium]